ncbi:hypothetical protein Cgig2_014802 [Carnegiea gigantea]|uniref:OCRE domain-containing protein n=1 Tax=Carnegiea gigantea TaxID=171969 RepID=A0A9Q1L202_9CARY|nr:hypothetical protein Cgig2_014802 [Carnegiea gigantea]
MSLPLDVYHEEREVFLREAEGYEALARARNNDLSGNEGYAFDMFADENDVANNPEQSNQTSVPSEGTGQLSGGTDTGDSGSMLGDHLLLHYLVLLFIIRVTIFLLLLFLGSWTGQTDYIYDEASGYYYSSRLGYYYDPAAGLFYSAVSGQWYKYNEDTGVYDEVQPEPDREAGSENNEDADSRDQLQPEPEVISNVSGSI